MEKFTFRSFDHPNLPIDQIEESYFDTIDECKKWCEDEQVVYRVEGREVSFIHFEIHASYGAKTFMFGRGLPLYETTWKEVPYDLLTIPTIEPWWSINDIPKELLRV